MIKIFLTLMVLSVAFATQYVPIPKRQVGILLGSPNADVKIQLIYDPVCDDSAAFEVKFQQAWNLLSTDIKEKISLRYTSLSLPYHIVSQKLTQAIVYVQQVKGNQQAVVLFRDFLTYLDQYDQMKIRNETIGGLMIRIAQRVNSFFDLKTQDVLKELAHGSASDAKVRQWSKAVMGSMKAAGTPRLRINGVIVDNATGRTVQQLVDLIKSLVAN